MALSSLIRYVEVKDSAATDGSGLTGKVYSDFTAKYLVQGGTLTSLTPQDITTLGTFQAPSAASNIRIKEVNSAAPTKGIYEIHFHDTQLVASGKTLWLFLSVTGGVPVRLEIDLLAHDVVSINQVSTSNVTTINANIGTTQPTNFTGTGGSALVQSDAVDIGGTAQTGLDLAANWTAARAAHLDADISSRMATYTQPTGFLSATFPSGTIANTTNITAGTITTVTNLTNLPSIPNNWITAAGIAADAITAAKIADGAIDAATFASGVLPTNFSSLAIDASGRIDVGSWLGFGVSAGENGIPDVNVLYVDDTLASLYTYAVDKTGYALTSAYDSAKTAAQAGDAMALTSGERDTLAAAILTLANGIESGYTLKDTLRIMLAALAGKAAGAATTTMTFRDPADTTDRITATVDADGNRSAVTLDAT